jgi:hypothetical protein
MIYKVASITDKQGNPKLEPFEDCLKLHPNMEGEFLYFDLMCQYIVANAPTKCCFIWNDNTDKMMRTSDVEYVIGKLGDNEIVVTTRNSVYKFELKENN